MDFVWLLMSNSELLRIKNKQKAPYKKQKTASSYYNYTLNGLMTDLGLILNVRRCSFIIYIFLLTHNNIKHHHQHETYGEADGAEIAVLAA